MASTFGRFTGLVVALAALGAAIVHVVKEIKLLADT
jgi:hypothetical protein